MPMPKGFRERPGFAPTLKLDIGQEIIGRILTYKVVPVAEKAGKTREQGMIQMETEKGRFTFWLSANLEDRVSEADVDKRIWIERLADQPIEGQPSPMKAYNVAVEA